MEALPPTLRGGRADCNAFPRRAWEREKDWDLAAPELILTEAGGKFTHFDGTPLQYNTGDVNQWGGLLASNGQCHEELCQEAERILAEVDNLKIRNS